MTNTTEEFHVCILKCADGTLYTGFSRGSPSRYVAAHNAGNGDPYTKGRLPVHLLAALPAGSRRWRAIGLLHEFRQLSKREKQKLLAGDAAVLSQVSEKGATVGRRLEEYHETNKRMEKDQ